MFLKFNLSPCRELNEVTWLRQNREKRNDRSDRTLVFSGNDRYRIVEHESGVRDTLSGHPSVILFGGHRLTANVSDQETASAKRR